MPIDPRLMGAGGGGGGGGYERSSGRPIPMAAPASSLPALRPAALPSAVVPPSLARATSLIRPAAAAATPMARAPVSPYAPRPGYGSASAAPLPGYSPTIPPETEDWRMALLQATGSVGGYRVPTPRELGISAYDRLRPDERAAFGSAVTAGWGRSLADWEAEQNLYRPTARPGTYAPARWR